MMKKVELIHSHILMAIFCGWEAQKPNKMAPNGFLSLSEEDGTLTNVSNDDILEELPYSTDWNYLMPAWSTFEDEVKTYAKTGDDLDKIWTNIADAILGYNIDLAFKELLRGINLISEIKLKEHE